MRQLCASDYLEVDVYSPHAMAGAEYDGAKHAQLSRRTHDADRLSVLGMLGISIRTLTAKHFYNQLEFHRAINAIAVLLGVDAATDADFQKRQNSFLSLSPQSVSPSKHWKGNWIRFCLSGAQKKFSLLPREKFSCATSSRP